MPYRGIENLKSADEEVELTQEQLNTFKLCQNDPYLFINTFVQTTSKDGTHLLKPSPRQRAELDVLQNQRFVKSDWYRQSGYTTIVLSYFLWKAMFTPNLVLTYCAPKKAQAYAEFDLHIRQAILSLPYAIQPGIKTWTEHTVTFKNGSSILARPADQKSIAGFASDYLFIDEFGWLTDKKMLELTQSEFVCMKHSARRHLILANSQIFSAHSEANTLYWKNCDIPFYASVNTWCAKTKEEEEFEQDMRKRMGDKAFEAEYVGIKKDPEKKKLFWAEKIDSLPDLVKKNHWKATFHSQKADWTWIQDNMAVTSFANSQVEFNGYRYPGVILGVSEYEGHPVSGMDLGGLVNVDIEYFDWQYGKSAGKVRYKCLALPSMVEAASLDYGESDHKPLTSTIKLIVVERLGLTYEKADVPETTYEEICHYRCINNCRESISSWLESNVKL